MISETPLSDGSVLVTWEEGSGVPGDSHCIVWETPTGCWAFSLSIHNSSGYTPPVSLAEEHYVAMSRFDVPWKDDPDIDYTFPDKAQAIEGARDFAQSEIDSVEAHAAWIAAGSPP